MPFPEWEYYTLAQAAARWTATLEEVQHAIVAGKLHASVWLSPTYAYTITEHSPDNATRHPAQQLEGYVRVAPESCRIIFSKGVVARRKFLTHQPDSHYLIVEHLDKVEMRIEDLLILTEDMRSFEKAHNFAASQPCKVISVHKIKRDTPPQAQPMFNQQNDYRLVRLNGYQFTFGEIQAAIIRQLHEASTSENSWIHGKTLLANAGSSSMIMRDAFRHQAHWKELIHSNGRGYYRLSPICSPMPALSESQASPSHNISLKQEG